MFPVSLGSSAMKALSLSASVLALLAMADTFSIPSLRNQVFTAPSKKASNLLYRFPTRILGASKVWPTEARPNSERGRARLSSLAMASEYENSMREKVSPACAFALACAPSHTGMNRRYESLIG